MCLRPDGIASVQLVVAALLDDQLDVGDSLDDAALLQHHDAVGDFHGGEPVGDHKGGAAGHWDLYARAVAQVRLLDLVDTVRKWNHPANNLFLT